MKNFFIRLFRVLFLSSIVLVSPCFSQSTGEPIELASLREDIIRRDPEDMKSYCDRIRRLMIGSDAAFDLLKIKVLGSGISADEERRAEKRIQELLRDRADFERRYGLLGCIQLERGSR